MIEYLPSDWRQAVLVGRMLTRDGPTPIVVVEGRVRDVSRHAATVSQLLNAWNGDIPAGKDLGTARIFRIHARSSPARKMFGCCRRSICSASRQAA